MKTPTVQRHSCEGGDAARLGWSKKYMRTAVDKSVVRAILATRGQRPHLVNRNSPKMPIPVVDIFAGPGGLGEGFSAFSPSGTHKFPFRIAISAEMEPHAAKTLQLRAFFRQFPPGDVPASYYEYLAGRAAVPWTDETKRAWEAAAQEARRLTLGEPADDEFLHARIRQIAARDRPWVLIGGPPCQAYSLVGRSRNAGKLGYRAEDDHRHFLYTHYLRILKDFRPAAFVMENVKGILSSKVGGNMMFPRILSDLQQPGGRGGPRYRVIPLVDSAIEGDKDQIGRRFVLRAEELGVPQARHRVVLLGVSEDVSLAADARISPKDQRFGVSEVIGGMPRLRSGVTDRELLAWAPFAQDIFMRVEKVTSDPLIARQLRRFAKGMRIRDPGRGGRWMPKTRTSDEVPEHLHQWLIDPKLGGIVNHEVREHMSSDLKRYAYASTFAYIHNRSPRGPSEFPAALHPKHRNWKSGKFIDRFKVQIGVDPSSTVTSHLSKDGHYFIHPDPVQLRSLSVREAARLQTFPDNYFFEGSRGAQFRQVGNAVPPWMAKQIAAVVYSHIGS